MENSILREHAADFKCRPAGDVETLRRCPTGAGGDESAG
jgi:hypothetical protein